MQRHSGLLAWLGALAMNAAAIAADVPVTGLKLIVVDKLAATGTSKAVFVTKDPAVTKGAGTDSLAIDALLEVAYDDAQGSFDMPQGAAWLVNSARVAKYVNRLAPSGGAVKVSAIKPGSLVKVVAKSLGDAPLDISSPPSGAVYVVHTVANGGDTTRHCTQFTACAHKAIAAGTGYKLVCRGSSVGDPDCTASGGAGSTSTTTFTTSTTTTSLPPVAFRISDLDLRDPHMFVSFLGCRDVTDTPLTGFAVNDDYATKIQTDGTPSDGFLNLSLLSVFSPLDQSVPGGGTFTFTAGVCTAPMASTSCTASGSPLAIAFTNAGVGQCLAALAGTTRPFAPAVGSTPAPCFGGAPAEIAFPFLGISLPLHDVEIAATYGGTPATTLTSGLLRGFLTQADANTILLPAALPLIGGTALGSTLGGGGSCSPTDDRDTGPDGLGGTTTGWWFYFNYTATQVPYTP